MTDKPDTKTIKSACQFCPCECGINVVMEGGQVRNIYGEEKDPVQQGNLCPKSQLMPQMTYNPYRVTKPLRRRLRKSCPGDNGPREFSVSKGGGWLKKDSAGRVDINAMGFEEIDYDTAFKEIAAKLVDLKIKHGSEAFGAKMSSRSFRTTGAVAKNFFRLYGSLNITSSGPVCNDSASDALKITFGAGQHTNSYGKYNIKKDKKFAIGGEDLESSNFYLIFGANMAEQRPVLFAYLRKRIDERRRSGNSSEMPKMVVVDPRFTQTAARAEQWVQIRPGTDMALAYGMIHHIITNNLTDPHYCDNLIVGYKELEEHVVNNNYSPEWAAEITGISKEVIIELANEYAKAKPGAIFTNSGVAHHINAFDTFRVILFLVSITGNIGKAGAGANFTNNAGISKNLDGVLKKDADYIAQKKKLAKGLPLHPDYFPKSILLNSPVPENKDEIRPYSVRGIYYAGNMLTQNGNTEEVRKALTSQTLELFIKPSLFWEEDCYFADYVLPVKTHLESDGIGVRRDDRAARWKNPAINASDIYKEAEIIGEDALWARLGHAVKTEELKREKEINDNGRFYMNPEKWDTYLPLDWGHQKAVWEKIGELNSSTRRFNSDNMKDRTEPLHWPCPDIKDDVGNPHPGTGPLYMDEKDDGGFWFDTSVGCGKFKEEDRGKKRFWTLKDGYFDNPNEDKGKILVYSKKLDKILRGLHKDTDDNDLKDLKITETGHTALPLFYTDPVYSDLPTMSYTNRWIKNYFKTDNMTLKAGIDNGGYQLNGKYPYLLLTGRPTAVHFHSCTHWIWHSAQMNGHRIVQMHPKTAEKILCNDNGDEVKIKNGDKVAIETEWGKIEAPVLLWDGIAENTVFVPMGFGDKQKVHEDVRKPIYQSVNTLTNNNLFDTLSYQVPYKLNRCNIKKL